MIKKDFTNLPLEPVKHVSNRSIHPIRATHFMPLFLLSIQFLCSNLLIKESHAGGVNLKSPRVKLARVAWVPINRLLDTLLVFNSL